MPSVLVLALARPRPSLNGGALKGTVVDVVETLLDGGAPPSVKVKSLLSAAMKGAQHGVALVNETPQACGGVLAIELPHRRCRWRSIVPHVFHCSMFIKADNYNTVLAASP